MTAGAVNAGQPVKARQIRIVGGRLLGALIVLNGRPARTQSSTPQGNRPPRKRTTSSGGTHRIGEVVVHIGQSGNQKFAGPLDDLSIARRREFCAGPIASIRLPRITTV